MPTRYVDAVLISFCCLLRRSVGVSMDEDKGTHVSVFAALAFVVAELAALTLTAHTMVAPTSRPRRVRRLRDALAVCEHYSFPFSCSCCEGAYRRLVALSEAP